MMDSHLRLIPNQIQTRDDQTLQRLKDVSWIQNGGLGGLEKYRIYALVSPKDLLCLLQR
jgi:hypothetical protein